MRYRVRLSLACAAFVAAFAHAVVTGQPGSGPAPSSPSLVQNPGSQAAAPKFPAAVQGEYAGTAACLTCHSDKEQDYKSQLHGKAAHPRSPEAGLGCESCHGPAKNHAEDPSDVSTLKVFLRMAPGDTNAICLTCHTRGNHALWEGSTHDARNLSCVTCHSIHSSKSEKNQLKTTRERDTCATCHREKVAKIDRSGHMPLREGKMECSTCHNPHGSTNVKQLRKGDSIAEACTTCHADKRGPFLWEHAPTRDGCITCHDPHGSSNERMLVTKPPILCQRCHIATRHPSTIYDGALIGSGATPSVRIYARSCVTCHANIHGSNHPSGQRFIR